MGAAAEERGVRAGWLALVGQARLNPLVPVRQSIVLYEGKRRRRA